MPKLPKRRRRKLVAISVMVLVLGGAFAWRTFRTSDDAIAVQVEKVARRDITETVVANGRIQPVTQIVISPEVAGEIIELPVVEGQSVKKGDLLLQIKPDNYQASRNSAEANYKFALGSRSQAEAELEKAAVQFKQNEELYKNKLISESVYMDFRTTHEV